MKSENQGLLDRLERELREHATMHGADAPDGFNYWKYDEAGDHWRCGECGKHSKEGHASYCFKLTLLQAADALARVSPPQPEPREPDVVPLDTPVPESLVPIPQHDDLLMRVDAILERTKGWMIPVAHWSILKECRDELEARVSVPTEPPTLEQLAAQQGVNPQADVRDLAGGWPEEEEIDEFLAATHQSSPLAAGVAPSPQEPVKQCENEDLVNALTAIVPDVGWLRSCFFPALNEAGWSVVRSDTGAPPQPHTEQQ